MTPLALASGIVMGMFRLFEVPASLAFGLMMLLAGIALPSHAEVDTEWRHQARHDEVMLNANPLGHGSRTAFYAARGFSTDAIQPYALACGFSFGMQNGGSVAISTRLAGWRAVDAQGRSIGFRLPESWDAGWTKAGVPQSARIAFRWAQFQAENRFERGDWIMGMATLESTPAEPFRLIARYHDNKGDHEIVLNQLECARD